MINYCSNCGAELSDDSDVCSECGQQVRKDPISFHGGSRSFKFMRGLDAVVGLFILLGSAYFLLALSEGQSLVNVISGLATTSSSAPGSSSAPMNVMFGIAENIGIATLMFTLFGISYGAKRFIENVMKIIKVW